MEDQCLFCAIAAQRIPADIVLAGEDVVAFRDIAPQAPVHVLVVPREHHANIAVLSAADPALTSRLFAAAAALAQDLGVSEGGYRLVVNTGADGGQSVDHVHVHLLGKRQMAWPPG